MNFHVLTLFPEMILAGLSESIIGKAKEKGAISIQAVNIRDYTEDKHKKVDDYPYGGGAGLLMQAQPVYDAHKALCDRIGAEKKVRTIYLTPQGTTFNQRMAEELAKEEDLIFLCGHYEGIDERALEEVVTDYVSLGDFVLTGGELPAMVMIDAISRLVPGVLNNEESANDESFSGYLLEYPQYSRPEIWHGKEVPKVLLSGDHKKIRQWRQEMAKERTRMRRPDMYKKYERIMAAYNRLAKNKLLHMDMLELIKRGNAVLLYDGVAGTLLKDKVSGLYTLTVQDKESGIKILNQVFGEPKTETEIASGMPVSDKKTVDLFVVHQEYMTDVIAERFGLEMWSGCFQYVYTKKESLPKIDADIRRLDASYLDVVYAHYDLTDRDDILRKLNNGKMYGIFVEDKLAGFAGEHEEGSMGMLEIFPEYRGQGLATALETDLINRTLHRGDTPYCQIREDNNESIRLQEKLGLYPAKEKIWWFM